jgi:dolichyl-phosphate-mannose-protein mannosyltransferase
LESNAKIAQTSQPALENKAVPPPVQQQQAQQPVQDSPNGDEGAAGISGAPQFEPQAQKVIGKEERVEYRDQDGNLLNEEQVKALEGKVEFKTRYETRTRVVDAEGNEVPGADVPVAPPHPDVEGADSSTKQKAPEVAVADGEQQKVVKSKDGEKEKEAEKPKPASEGNEATAQ